MSEAKRYTAWAAEVALPRGTMVVLAADYDALLARAKTAEADFLAAAECNVEQRKTIQRLQAELATERLRADAAAGDANAAERRVAELEGLLRECKPTVQRARASRNGADYDSLADRIDAALAGQQQQGEQCVSDEGKCGLGGYCEPCPAKAEQPVIYPEDGPDERAALSTALFNALESYEASRGKFSRKDQKIHAKQCELIRQHAAQLLAGQPAAVDERRDWSCYDTTFLLEHIRRDTNFDADLIGAMLKFSQTAQPFCHRMTVVMPERTVARFPNSWASGWNACLDKLTCLNRNTVPLELLERVADTLDDICNGSALERELRAILGAKP